MVITFLGNEFDLGVAVFGIVMFVLLAMVAEAGYRLGRRRIARRAPGDKETACVSTLTTGMLGLMAFTLALTIGFAQERFEARRATTLVEANTIGTAWLRTGLAGAAGAPIAGLIEEYARVRLAYLQASPGAAVDAELLRTARLQTEIWQRTLPVLEGMPGPLAAALVASLNEMFDANLSQRYALESRVPAKISLMLLIGAMLAIGALGYQMGLAGQRQFPLAVLLLAMLTGAMVLVADLNRPRLGFTRVDAGPLVWTIQGFAPSPAPR